MKKTILALAIASSVVLLTGCNAEDEAVENSGAKIKTENVARDYAKKVKVMNELILKNVTEHCIDPASTKVTEKNCLLNPAINNGNFAMEGKVEVLLSGSNFIIQQDKYAKSLILRENNKANFKVNFLQKDNNHKITLTKMNSADEFSVSFSGQYSDSHAKPFQSTTLTNFTYSKNTYGFLANQGSANLVGRDSKTYKWKVISGSVDIIK